MKEIFEQYGGVLITVTAIVAVVAIVSLLIGTGEGSIVYKAFHDLLTNFFKNAAGGMYLKPFGF